MGGISGFFPFQPGGTAFENAGEGPGYFPDITGGGSSEDPFTLHVPVVGNLPSIGGGTFGPIFSPMPPIDVHINYGGPSMPISDFTQARGTILGSIIRSGIGGVIGALPPIIGGFEPGQLPVPCIPGAPVALGGCPGSTGENTPVYPQPMGGQFGPCPTTRSGKYLKPAQCYVRTKTGRVLRGRITVINGVPCCRPIRHMNAANAHALSRAARRLRGFAKLEKRIHKALNRAMGPAGRRMGRSYRPKCGTCRKTKCVC